MKSCRVCKAEKPLSEFHNDKSKRDGKSGRCIDCTREYRAEYYRRNSGRLKEYSLEWYRQNRDYAAKRGAEKYQKNKDSLKEARKRIYWMNRDENCRKSSEYHLARIKSDPYYRFVARVRTRIYQAISGKGYSKKSKSFVLIGCSQDELFSHIESQLHDGMTWDNYGEWHVDHIIPLSAARSAEEVEMLCHYTNMQPLWASDNISKSAKYCPDELEHYLRLRSVDSR